MRLILKRVGWVVLILGGLTLIVGVLVWLGAQGMRTIPSSSGLPDTALASVNYRINAYLGFGQVLGFDGAILLAIGVAMVGVSRLLPHSAAPAEQALAGDSSPDER